MVCMSEHPSSSSGEPRPVGLQLRSLTAAICAIVLFGLSIFVYSPLHRHDPISGKPCPFCLIQHLSAHPAVTSARIVVSAPGTWFVTPTNFVAQSCFILRIYRDRARPPAFFVI